MEEKNISVRESSSKASGYVGVRKLPSGRFEVRPLGTFDSAYEAAVAYGMLTDEVGEAECKCIGLKGDVRGLWQACGKEGAAARPAEE